MTQRLNLPLWFTAVEVDNDGEGGIILRILRTHDEEGKEKDMEICSLLLVRKEAKKLSDLISKELGLETRRGNL